MNKYKKYLSNKSGQAQGKLRQAQKSVSLGFARYCSVFPEKFFAIG
jgi:hypothetical protein